MRIVGRHSLAWLALPLVLACQPPRASSADLMFSGRLIRIGRESISIQLGDRRVIDARIASSPSRPADMLTAGYRTGDEVQVACRSIEPVWTEDTSGYQFLALTKLSLVRHPAPEERSQTTAFPPAETGVRDEVAQRNLDHARTVNLQYASEMPNFVADETATRYRSQAGSPRWRHVDTIQSEITFTGNQAVRSKIRKDGTPWKRPFQALPGFKWYGGFGTELRPLFDPQCPTNIEYEGAAKVNGKPVLEYRFSSPADGCFGFFYSTYQRFNPARSGRVSIDDPGGHLIRLHEDAEGFPTGFEFSRRTEEVSWDFVPIGSALRLLPVEANFVVRYSSGVRWRVAVEYTNHRHFESAATVTYP